MSYGYNLLLAAAARRSRAGVTTVGKAGTLGFGVGFFPGSKDELKAMGLSEASDGFKDPTSEHFCEYVHTNGSRMTFIPAFCYRIGNASAPSYSRDGVDALEVRDATEFSKFAHNAAYADGYADFGDGWILHRAFIDGGLVKNGFFIDKFLCSKSAAGLAVSVKNADWLQCVTGSTDYVTQPLTDCVGQAMDALTLCRARGDHYSVTTCFQWSALAILATAHGQAATSADACAWYDANHVTNFPKGDTKAQSGHADVNDASVTFTSHTDGYFSKTGSASQYAKTTHNGQLSGVADVAGMCNQITLGAGPCLNYGEYWLLKPSIKAHDISKDNRNSSAHYEALAGHWNTTDGIYYWGTGSLYTEASGSKWSACGVIPSVNKTGADVFGKDEFRAYQSGGNWDRCMFCGLGYQWGTNAGVWCRALYGYNSYGYNYNWLNSYRYFGFRASGYAS